MTCVRLMTLMTAMLLLPLVMISFAEDGSAGAYAIEMRTGKHDGFKRVVFEGHKSVISMATVIHNGKDISVVFAEPNFEIKSVDSTLRYKTDGKTVSIPLKQVSKVKSFSIDKPNRLVVDIYHKKTATKMQELSNKDSEKKDSGKTDARTTNARLNTQTVEKAEQKTDAAKDPAESQITDNAGQNAKSIGTDKTGSAEKVSRAAAVPNDGNNKIKKAINEQDLIPEKYKAMWSLLESGNFYAVLKELPAYKSEDSESLAAYYYVYAKANIMAKQFLDAVKYLRLAYIYAKDDQMKEHMLYTRAGIYRKQGLVYEARADYIIFIRDFPSSNMIEEAHLGLAESLYQIGEFRKALKHYQKSGTQPEALFGMANTMQKLDEVDDAKKVYEKAVLKDKSFLKRSHETAYLMAENMRMSGDLAAAKKKMTLIDFGPFRDNASISLGLIAMNEENIEEAVRKFNSAARSRDQKIKVQALFNLSLAYMKDGKFEEAASTLENIRHDHIDSFMYKDTLLVLSKLYHKEGRTQESVSLLKELVYGKQPPADAFRELERIILETSAKSADNDLTLASLWNEVGQWLVDERREGFLLKVAKGLRNEGKPFLDLSSWLVENGSNYAKGRAAVDLADYYISIGNQTLPEEYISIAKAAGQSGDGVVRIQVKILKSKGKVAEALRNIMEIKKMRKDDLDQLGYMIAGLDAYEEEDMQNAIAFYEKTLNQSEWDAEIYAIFADILYRHNDREKSLKYYRIANKKDPHNEWAMYRVGRDTGMPESEDMFSRLKDEDNLYGRLAKSKLMEIALVNRVKEVY